MRKTIPIPPALLLAVLVVFSSCGGGRRSSQDNAMNQYIANTQSVGKVVELITTVSPTNKEDFKQGDIIPIGYSRGADTEPLDSVVLSIEGKRIGRLDPVWEYRTEPDEPVGRVAYRVTAYRGADSTVRVGEFVVKAAEPPIQYTYRVKNSYPHDPRAYTQGLFWHDGYLYESTGQEKHSTLRKVNLQTGEVLKLHKLEDKYFGEGTTYLNGKIYQLTWQHRRGFIYNAETFEQIGEFGYNGDGWGLTTDGQYLYMSNGSERITVLDPETFRRVRAIDVYTDEGRISQVNELQWIEGEIWANVYLTDIILRIDPATGAVKGIIDLKRILPTADKDLNTDVLNGIAYDPDAKRIFVTGKMWKKLFEIEVVKK